MTPIAGLIEGFYGPPWSEDDRIAVGRWCAARGMTHYVYAPKDDPKHRLEWREPYTPDELASLERVAAGCGLHVGFAVSPGLSIDYGDADDRSRLLAKLDSVIDIGIDLVCLALDDIPPRPGLGDDQAALCEWLVDALDGRASLLLVPTEYVGLQRSRYLDALAARVPPGVPIAWTGVQVMNDEITAEHVRARAEAVGGRAPLIWDNYPVNDAMMSDQLFMGPLRGRDAGAAEECAGWLANPMVQPRSSMLPLASVAAYLRGEDPARAWRDAADAAGLRTFAEACDGEVPLELARAVAEEAAGPSWAGPAGRAEAWFEAARACAAPGLEGEVGEWLAQVQREARLALRAISLFRAAKPTILVEAGRARVLPPDPMAALAVAAPVIARWPRLRRSPVSVLGRRFGFSPCYGQGVDGAWRWDPRSLTDADNALDVLCRVALDALAAIDGSPAIAMVDGVPVTAGEDGWFPAPSGSVVVARAGRALSRVAVP